MNEEYPELLEDLRTLGSAGPRQAPAHVEQRLRAQFRRQNRKRKFVTWAPVFSVAAAAVIGLVFWIRSEAPRSGAAAVAMQQAVAPVAEEYTEAGFYPLPEAEALPALENAMIVRVQLPVSSLHLMGFPVAEERADASVQADLLVGQDGLARGVRLAQ